MKYSRPLIAAGATTFFLIKKQQKIKTEKTFCPQGQLPGPVFRRAFARLDGWHILPIVIARNEAISLLYRANSQAGCLR
jgi:hypothetical protein